METLERTVDQNDTKVILMAPIIATNQNREFDMLRHSTGAINCVGNPQSDEGMQALADAENKGYFFVYAGREANSELAYQRAKEKGLILDTCGGFLQVENFGQIHDYLGYRN